MSVAPRNNHCVVSGKLDVAQLCLARQRQAEQPLSLVLFFLVQACCARTVGAQVIGGKNGFVVVVPYNLQLVWRYTRNLFRTHRSGIQRLQRSGHPLEQRFQLFHNGTNG